MFVMSHAWDELLPGGVSAHTVQTTRLSRARVRAEVT